MNQPTRQALVWIVRCIHWFVWPHESYINIAGERALHRIIFSTHLDLRAGGSSRPSLQKMAAPTTPGWCGRFQVMGDSQTFLVRYTKRQKCEWFSISTAVITFNCSKVLSFGQLSSVQYLPAWVMFWFAANTNLSASHVKLIVEI